MFRFYDTALLGIQEVKNIYFTFFVSHTSFYKTPLLFSKNGSPNESTFRLDVVLMCILRFAMAAQRLTKEVLRQAQKSFQFS